MKVKKKSGVKLLRVYIAPESDLSVDDLHQAVKMAALQSGQKLQDYMFRRLMGDPGFRKAREQLQKRGK